MDLGAYILAAAFQCLLDSSRSNQAELRRHPESMVLSVSFGFFVKVHLYNINLGCTLVTAFSVFWILQLAAVNNRDRLEGHERLFQCLLDSSDPDLYEEYRNMKRRAHLSVSFGFFEGRYLRPR